MASVYSLLWCEHEQMMSSNEKADVMAHLFEKCFFVEMLYIYVCLLAVRCCKDKTKRKQHKFHRYVCWFNEFKYYDNLTEMD